MKKQFIPLASLLFLTTAADAFAATCTISRTNLTDPAISWDNGDIATTNQVSRFNPEACNVEPGSIITSIRLPFNYDSNPTILTNGLLWGDYRLQVSAGGQTGYSATATVSASNVRSIGSGGGTLINTFNGMDLHGLNFNIVGDYSGSITNFRCLDATPSVCDAYFSAEYTLEVNYDAPDPIPTPPSSVTAKLNGDDITITWSSVTGATYYNREVRLNGGEWINTKTYNHPQTSVTFFNQRPRTYQYRVRACNGAGCSSWKTSNSLTVLPYPSIVAASANSNNDITISWSHVSGATYYNREVSLNGGEWINRKTYNQPQTSVTFFNQQPRTYQYRARACNTDGCSAWNNSNTITIN